MPWVLGGSYVGERFCLGEVTQNGIQYISDIHHLSFKFLMFIAYQLICRCMHCWKGVSCQQLTERF